MDLSVVIAIIRRERLEAVEKAMREIDVKSISVSKVKGYGEYHNFFAGDWMVESVRVEIFTRKDKVDAIASAIMNAAHTGSAGDGVVAVYPVERFFNIRLRSEAVPDHVAS
ncbi:MAG TPA: P-II family nitrogen regulator [Burkholderiales bacterium]|nr:P-II family nitrogen regulator [Burkholderiales bacterium]